MRCMMRFLKKPFRFIVEFCVVAFCLTGCWDRNEVNDLALILAAGIDKGKGDNIELSAEIYIPRQQQGGQGGMSGGKSSGQSFVRSAEGETIADAMARLQEALTREVFWGQNEVLLIGEKLAKEGLGNQIDFWMRHAEPRIRADVFVSKGRAKKMLGAMPELERDASKQLRKMVKTHVGVKVTVKDLSEMLSGESGAAVLPWVENLNQSSKDVNEKAIPVIKGAAIFKGEKMTGKLNDKEIRGVLWPRNEIKSGVITISLKNEKGYISLNLLNSKSELIPSIKNGKWRMHIKTKTDMEVIQNTTRLDLFDAKVIREAQQKVAYEIEQRERLAFLKVQGKLHADIFGFSEEFQRKYPQIWKQKKNQWDEIFPEVAVSFETKVQIKRTGLASGKNKRGAGR